MLRQSCYILIFLLSISADLQSQSWRLLNEGDGLPSLDINDVKIDGPNVWIATNSGLCNYDGQNIITYDVSNSNLASNNIKEIELINGEVFMATDSGFSVYNGRSIVNYDTSNGLLDHRVYAITQDTNQILWVATVGGISRFNGINFTHDTGKIARDIIVDDSNRVYILRYTVVFNIPTAGLTVYEIYDGQNWSSPTMGAFSDYYSSKFYKSPNGKIMLLPSGGGNQFYAELSYPFNLSKRPIITGNPSARTPRYINDLNGERWINYNGASSLYRGDNKDSTYQPMYLLPTGARVRAMDANQQITVIATDQGLLIGPANSDAPKIQKELDINQLRVGMHLQGALFHNYNDTEPAFEFPADSNTHLLYYSNFQMAYKKDNSQSNISVYPVEVLEQAYEGGPYHRSNQIFGDEYVIKIDKSEIDFHIQNFNSSNYQMSQSIQNWPAAADSSIASSPDLAPFQDLNQNGCYEPLLGDYPLIKGDQAIYWINHPMDKSLALEYHWMMYGYSSSSDTALNRSAFVQLRVVNRDTIKYDYLKLGLKTEAVLGNPFDNFVGSDTLLDMMYFYNGDSFDENRLGRRGYLGNPPAVGIRSLETPMSSATFFQTKIGNSQPNIDTWSYIHGLDGDSTAFKDPFTNNDTRFHYTGDPFSQTGWSEINLNPNILSGNIPGQREGTMSFPAFSLNPGESHTVDFVVNVSSRTLRTGIAEYLPLLRRRMTQLKTFYDNRPLVFPSYSLQFNCPVIVGSEEIAQVNSFKIYPNPSAGIIKIEGMQIQQIEVRDIQAKLIKEISNQAQSETIDLRMLKKGMYFLRIYDGVNWHTEKILLLD